MNRRLLGLVCLATAMLFVVSVMPVRATQNLEKTQEWVANGDTVVNAVYASELYPGSGVKIITLGSAVTGVGVKQAQLRIWTWSGTTLTLDKGREFTLGDSTSTFPTEYGLGVFAGHLDGGSGWAIVTVGYAVDTNGANHDHLAIWTWDGTTLTRRIDLGRASPATMRGVYAYDFDGTYMEIVTVGENGNNNDGVIYVWNWAGGGTITQVSSASWTGTSIQVRGVYIESIKGGTTKQIITAGTVTQTGVKYGHVRVYDYTNGAPVFADDDLLRFSSHDTELFSVFAGQFDNSHTDVAACGNFDNSGNPEAGVQIFRWNSGTSNLDERVPHPWLPTGVTATQCRGVFGADLNTSHTGVEIVAGGYALISGTENGEVRTFNYDGGTTGASFSNEEYTDWVLSGNTRVNGVFCANVDSDTTIEFLSAGQGVDSHGTINAQLRIWHLS